MKNSLLFNFSVDKENNKINVEREFAAPVSNVWAAWTEPKLLDQWWAPKPWQAKTKIMDFREGGHWIYAMTGPEGEEHWAIAEYVTITPQKSFLGKDSFSDSEGNINKDFPTTLWKVNFNEKNGSTIVSIENKYDTLEDLETYIQMGFKEGFTAALENLDALLAK